MTPGVEHAVWLLALPAALLCGLLLLTELAWRLARGREADTSGRAAASVVAGVAFSLLALVLAFAYADASARLQTQRALAVQEANAISDVWHGIDLLDEAHQAPARALLRSYTTERVRAYDTLPDLEEYDLHCARATALLDDLWHRMVAATAPPDRLLLLPPVLAMGDVAVARSVAVSTHLSVPAFVVMFLLASAGAALLGIATSAPDEGRHWPYWLVVALAVAGSLHVVIDMEYPRSGIDQAARADGIVAEVLASMEP